MPEIRDRWLGHHTSSVREIAVQAFTKGKPNMPGRSTMKNHTATGKSILNIDISR
jgi:hypothetical protein